MPLVKGTCSVCSMTVSAFPNGRLHPHTYAGHGFYQCQGKYPREPNIIGHKYRQRPRLTTYTIERLAPEIRELLMPLMTRRFIPRLAKLDKNAPIDSRPPPQPKVTGTTWAEAALAIRLHFRCPRPGAPGHITRDDLLAASGFEIIRAVPEGHRRNRSSWAVIPNNSNDL